MIPPTPHQIETYADSFEESFVKVSFVRKVKNKWKVFSHKGKVLGTYDTKEEANKRLRQIEFFKHQSSKNHDQIKQATKDDEPTYSSIMRALNKDNKKDLMQNFQQTFKAAFDKAYMSGEEHPEQIALEKAKLELEAKTAELKDIITKTAAAIELGKPEEAGRYLAALVKFLLKRISPEKRAKAINSMKNKIYYINEYTIASKRTPPSSSMGQSLTILKTLLLEHNPIYIRSVLNEIVKAL